MSNVDNALRVPIKLQVPKTHCTKQAKNAQVGSSTQNAMITGLKGQSLAAIKMHHK